MAPWPETSPLHPSRRDRGSHESPRGWRGYVRRWLSASSALTFSLLASCAFVIAGLAAVVLVVARGDFWAADLMLIGGIPVVGGLVTGLLGLRARSMAA